MNLPIQSSIASVNWLSTQALSADSLAAPQADLAPVNGDFQQMLFNSLGQVNQLEHQAQMNIEGRLLGEDITSAEVFTSMRKADMALKMMMQVRNKLVDAYQEIQNLRM